MEECRQSKDIIFERSRGSFDAVKEHTGVKGYNHSPYILSAEFLLEHI